jgi:hypothetical protein
MQRDGGYIRPDSEQRLGKHAPTATVTYATGETGRCLRGPHRGIKKKRTGATSSVDSWELSSVREAVKIEPERVKLKIISTVRSRCQGTAGEDTAGWKRLSGRCSDLRIVEISDSIVSRVYKWSIHSPIHTPSTATLLNRDNMKKCNVSIGLIRKDMVQKTELLLYSSS